MIFTETNAVAVVCNGPNCRERFRRRDGAGGRWTNREIRRLARDMHGWHVADSPDPRNPRLSDDPDALDYCPGHPPTPVDPDRELCGASAP